MKNKMISCILIFVFALLCQKKVVFPRKIYRGKKER